MGLGKLTIEATLASHPVDNTILNAIADFNWLYYSGVLLAISIFLVVFLSLMTEKMDDAQLKGITFGTLSPEDKAEIRASWDKFDIFLTVLVVGLVLTMYLYFSFWLV